MTLEMATLSPECTAALEAYQVAGGVIDFAVFAAPDGLTGETLQLQATLQAHAMFDGEKRAEPTVLAPIPAAEFLGTLSTSVGVFERPGPFLEARAQALATRGGFGLSPGDGFVYAFSDPPYSLLLNPSEAQGVFDAICDGLFGGFKDELEILRWSNDWSSYFDAGHEWWGAFWWTIHNRTRKTVMVVSASASD
jgi:hypothetical protein